MVPESFWNKFGISLEWFYNFASSISLRICSASEIPFLSAMFASLMRCSELIEIVKRDARPGASDSLAVFVGGLTSRVFGRPARLGPSMSLIRQVAGPM